MNPFFSFLLGTIERKVVTAVVLVVGIATFVVPQVGNLRISINEDFAAAPPVCAGRLQNIFKAGVGSACNKTPGCAWSNGQCVSSLGGGEDVSGSPVSATPQCTGGTSTVAISWPSKGETNYWVDIANNSKFSNNSNKQVFNGTTTTGPNGFSNSLTLNPGTKYYVQVYYPSTRERIPTSFTAQRCGGGGGGTPTPVPTSTANPLGIRSITSCSDTDGSDGRNIAVNGIVTFTLDNGKTLTIDESKNIRPAKAYRPPVTQQQEDLNYWNDNGWPMLSQERSTGVYLSQRGSAQTTACVDGFKGPGRTGYPIDTPYQWEFTCNTRTASQLKSTYSAFGQVVNNALDGLSNQDPNSDYCYPDRNDCKNITQKLVTRMTDQTDSLRRGLLSVHTDALNRAGLTLDQAISLGIDKYIEFIPGQKGESCSTDGTHVGN